MSKRALIEKLKKQVGQLQEDDLVRQISDLMDETAAAAHDGQLPQELTLEHLMETAHVPQIPQG